MRRFRASGLQVLGIEILEDYGVWGLGAGGKRFRDQGIRGVCFRGFELV